MTLAELQTSLQEMQAQITDGYITVYGKWCVRVRCRRTGTNAHGIAKTLDDAVHLAILALVDKRIKK